MAKHYCPQCHQKFSEDEITAVKEHGRWYCSHTCKAIQELREAEFRYDMSRLRGGSNGRRCTD